MSSVTVRRSIGVRVIVTEEFKQELKSELQEAATETQRRIDQMELHSRRLLADLQRTDLSQAMQARRQIEAERQRHDALKQDIQRQLQEADKLEVGSEYPRGNVEGVVDLQQGDDLVQKLSGSQIVVKDGVIVEIRES
ncbi:MAG TPA: YlqD family protein [Armatimonadota bacterium]|nr:YlqD family protein [Armatimonadota bacterium]